MSTYVGGVKICYFLKDFMAYIDTDLKRKSIAAESEMPE